MRGRSEWKICGARSPETPLFTHGVYKVLFKFGQEYLIGIVCEVYEEIQPTLTEYMYLTIQKYTYIREVAFVMEYLCPS